MTKRKRVLSALSGEVPDKVPKEIILSPEQMKMFRKKTGATDPIEYFDIEVRRLESEKLLCNDADFSSYLGELSSNVRVDEWGIAYLPGSLYHFERMIHPLRDIERVEEIENYPFPYFCSDLIFSEYREKVKRFKEKGYAVVGPGHSVGGTIFWPAYKLRGMENLLIDLACDSEIGRVLLDEVAEIISSLCKKVASCGVDIIWMGDNFGTQRDLMMSLTMWRRWFKPRLAKVIEDVRTVNPDVLVAFHSDGNISKIIPELIEIGIDILNPIQPEVLNPTFIKNIYGYRTALWGGIGTQTTMPFGSPKEVRQIVKEFIQNLGKEGGFLISPTHIVEPEVPWENIVAFIEAVDEFGRY